MALFEVYSCQSVINLRGRKYLVKKTMTQYQMHWSKARKKVEFTFAAISKAKKFFI